MSQGIFGKELLAAVLLVSVPTCKMGKRTSARFYRGFTAAYVERGRQVNSVFRGAVSEIVASGDLMNRGFYVYRALSPSSPTDLVVIDHNGLTAKVEVKTAHQREGIYYFSMKGIRADILAVVCNEQVLYTFWTDWGSRFFENIAKSDPQSIISVEQMNSMGSEPIPSSVPRCLARRDPMYTLRPALDLTGGVV